MSDMINPATRQQSPATERGKSPALAPSLTDIAVGAPARNALRRTFGEVTAGTSRLAAKLSPAQLVELIAGWRPQKVPLEATLGESSKVVPELLLTQPPLNIFSALTEKIGNLASLSIKVIGEAVDHVLSLLTARKSEVIVIGRKERPIAPVDVAAIQRQRDSVAGSQAIFEAPELQPPKDSSQTALVAALEQAALEIRREHKESKELAQQRAEDEQRRKISAGRDTLVARDLQNGIRSSATEEVIDQIEGPFAISLGTAIARIDEINRREEEETSKARQGANRRSR